MKLKATGLILAIAMLMGVAALPAAASNGTPQAVGVFNGVANVGKEGTCLQSGLVSGHGGGGLPLIPDASKNRLTWQITAGTALDSDPSKGLGTANLCGYIDGPWVNGGEVPGLGASCLGTKGYGGQGKAFNSTLDLTNLGWKIAGGGTFILDGHWSTNLDKDNTVNRIVAMVQVVGGVGTADCLTKSGGNPKSGLQPLDVVATYVRMSGGGNKVQSKNNKK